MFGKLFRVAVSPVTDVIDAVVDPFGADEPDGKIYPIVRATVPGIGVGQAIVDEFFGKSKGGTDE